MARAYSATRPQDFEPEAGGDWHSLRRELVSLLDQVEGHVGRSRHDDRLDSITERMRDLRHQMVEAEPDNRHREALRSVRRTVDRFNERDEASGYPAARNPRDTLESAIQQIRARQAELARRGAEPSDFRSPAAEPHARLVDSPRFDELARAVTGISSRLERLEGELRGAAKVQTGNVKEIADQVGQLSHVVELLAGAVGETGQVKRLESQIAGLAQLVAQGPRVDLSALTMRLDDLAATVGRVLELELAPRTPSSTETALVKRLDDVSETMGRLADLQVEFAGRVDMSTQSGNGVRESLHGIEGAMRAIEDGLRNVYDRIDAIERAEALPPVALDRITEELARVTETLQRPVEPEGLAHLARLVEALSDRVGSFESPHIDVSELKLDMELLRTTVAEAMEPRFAALEMQIEALNERVAASPGPDISVSQLEAQVRQLVARMDQTGEQLTGLARLYSTPAEREPAPDFEALADMVAARTSDLVAQATPAPPTLSGDDIDEIERRVSRLMATAPVAPAAASDDLAGIEASISAVNERLARLETSLTETILEAAGSTRVEPLPREADGNEFGHPSSPADAAHAHTIARLLEEETRQTEAPKRAAAGRGDAMPANPAADAPLRDVPFGPDSSDIAAALEDRTGTRRQHPGLTDRPGDDAPAPPETGADADFAGALPPRPVSSFDTIGPDFGPAPEIQAETGGGPVDEGRDAPATPSTNTFIAAARRAAMRKQSGSGSSGSGSLIARAFANFHPGQTADAEDEREAAPVAAPVPAAGREKPAKRRLARLLAGDKEPRIQPTPATTPGASEPAPVDGPMPDHDMPADEPAGESFLSRHRRPILLAASLVAIAFLTLNLISQRMSQPVEANAEPAVEASSVEGPQESGDSADALPSPLSAEPIAAAAGAVSRPRVVPAVDALATASIDPAAATGFTPASLPAPAASAFARSQPAPAPANEAAAAIETAALTPLAVTVEPPAELESPVQVEPPPPELGPQALREAAANGDARAQFEIAAIYTEGRAVPEDLAAAAIWYERSAAQGFAPAQYRLGNLYEHGRGVKKDLQLARLWYQRAAEAGNRMAMHNLAALYAGGELGTQQFDSAAEWFEQAARRGMRDSQFNLGMLYARGLGVTQDLEASYRWFSLAARRGDADAAKARDDVVRSLDAETVKRLDDEVAAFTVAEIDLAANFAPIGTWSDGFDPGETIARREVVMSVQEALNGLGFDVGTPDGLAGPKTADAIRTFERGTGMSESGAINPRLLAVLGSQPV